MVRKLYLSLFAIAIGTISSFAQCSGSLQLYQQSQVDAFASRGCSVFTGSIEIFGWNEGDVTNIDSLYTLERVNGSLTIDRIDLLTNLRGLRNLKSAGTLAIRENPLLTNLDGLDSLESIDELFMLDGNALTDISDLRGLRTCELMQIQNHPHLANLDGLQNLTTMRDFSLYANGMLNDLSALRGPRTVTNRLTIANNTLLTSLAGMEDIHLPDTADLFIYDSNFTSLDGLPSFDSLGDVVLFSNPQLTDISVFESVSKLDHLNLRDMPSITGLGDFSNLQSIGALSIISNGSLNSLDAFSSLNTVEGDVYISNNPALTNLQGLHNISNVGGTISINNQGLPDLTGLDGLVSAGALDISYNDNLTTLHGLESLQFVNGEYNGEYNNSPSLSLIENAVLNEVSALGQLTSLAGGMVISNCDSLRDLHGLEGLTSVGGMISIARNESLQTLAALSNVTSIGFMWPSPPASGGPVSFAIVLNRALKDLGIRKVQSLPASLRIIDNAALENVNDLGGLEQVGSSEFNEIDVQIRVNPALQNLDSLSSLRTIIGSGTKKLIVQNNENLDRFCGLYTVISEGPDDLDITITSNGAATTPEQIEADGPCSGEPAPQPGQLVFSAVTHNTMTVSFTPGVVAPTGGYLLLMRANTSPYPGDIPMDGHEYTVGQVIGSSTIVVGKGSGNEFHIVYLSPSTIYRFALYTFDSELDYATASPVIGGEMTLQKPEEATQPTSIVFSNITENSMTVSFTPSSSDVVDGYITVMRAYSSSHPDDIPADGTAYSVGNVIGSSSIVVGAGTATSLDIVYLNSDTEYWFDVYSYTNDNEYDYLTTNPLEDNQRTTPAMTVTAYPNPFTESVTIRFAVSEGDTRVRVMIFDNMGTPVAELLNADVGRGTHEVSWNGNDRHGNKATSGLYHYKISGRQEAATGTLVVK
ncbi:MAG TPA: FlgD immunoglobulin-like domain containing protein [Cyclobacteriaceae bacterium]|nr:FlgD immunoglobulin-like domain containing protein [Cyclobacteriaceae bacterium]